VKLSSPLRVGLVALAACANAPPGSDCATDRSCPGSLVCFANFKCYPAGADPACDPPCYGVEPFCDRTSLRCVACRDDGDCDAGSVCVPPQQRCHLGCDAVRACTDPGSTCDLTLHACQGCTSDSACTEPTYPRCTLATGVCDACAPDAGDCGATSFCTFSAGRFVCLSGCGSDGDCGDAGMRCCDHACTDTSASVTSCGGCGIACGSNETCCSGQCADLTTDTENCAACGRSCALPGVASPSCANGTCKSSGCESFFGDCDHDASNGCEDNLSYDGYNCSHCGDVCPAGPNQVPRCNLATCAPPSCAPGFGDCDGTGSNGCETPLDSTGHCGGCATACDAGQACAMGQCR
jgi:hypothetical protein